MEEAIGFANFYKMLVPSVYDETNACVGDLLKIITKFGWIITVPLSNLQIRFDDDKFIFTLSSSSK